MFSLCLSEPTYIYIFAPLDAISYSMLHYYWSSDSSSHPREVEELPVLAVVQFGRHWRRQALDALVGCY